MQAENKNVDRASVDRFVIRRLLCWIGIHDWHVLESKSIPEIDREVACEFDPLDEGEYRARKIGHQLQNKICLCCEKEVNQIEVYRVNRRCRMRVISDMFGVGAIEPRKWKIPTPPPPPPKSV